MRSFESQFFQVIGFQLDTIQLVVTAQIFYFLVCCGFVQNDIPVFVPSEFVEQIFFGQFFSILFFCTEVFGNRESGHQRRVVDGIKLYLIENFQRIG